MIEKQHCVFKAIVLKSFEQFSTYIEARSSLQSIDILMLRIVPSSL
jgi:hypothetical protein